MSEIEITTEKAVLFGVIAEDVQPVKSIITLSIKNIALIHNKLTIDVVISGLSNKPETKKVTYRNDQLTPSEMVFVGWAYACLAEYMFGDQEKRGIYNREATKYLTKADELLRDSSLPVYLMTKFNLIEFNENRLSYQLNKSDVLPGLYITLSNKVKNKIVAEGYVERGLKHFPNNLILISKHLSYLKSNDKFDEIIKYLDDKNIIDTNNQIEFPYRQDFIYCYFESLLHVGRIDEAENLLGKESLQDLDTKIMAGILNYRKKDYIKAIEYFERYLKENTYNSNDEDTSFCTHYILSCSVKLNNLVKVREILGLVPLSTDPLYLFPYGIYIGDIIEEALAGCLEMQIDELSKACASGLLAGHYLKARLPDLEQFNHRLLTSEEEKYINKAISLILFSLKYYPDNNSFNGIYSDLLFLKGSYDESCKQGIKVFLGNDGEYYVNVTLDKATESFQDNYVNYLKEILKTPERARRYIEYQLEWDIKHLFDKKKYSSVVDIYKWLNSELKHSKLGDMGGATLFEIAYSYNEMANLDQARSLYQKEKEIHGENSSILNNLANIYEKQGNAKKAISCISKARKLTKGIDDIVNNNYLRITRKYGKKAKKQSNENELIKKESINVNADVRRILSKFPTPKGTDWTKVKMEKIDNENIKISVGKVHKTYNYSEIGFKDVRKNLPDSQWQVLQYFAEQNGEVSYRQGNGAVGIQKRIQEIRKRLKCIMSIEDDPFYNYKKDHSYKTKFSIIDVSLGR